MKCLVLLMGCALVLGCPRGAEDIPVEESLDTGWLGPVPVVSVFPESTQRIQLQDSAVLLQARWQGAAPTDSQRVELVTPGGQVYQVFQTRLTPLGDAEVRLALGGSMVEEFKLHGTWKARFYLNAGNTFVREVAFEVEQ